MISFELEGERYFSQFRKCGKPTCRCAKGDEKDLHGPYWYKRNHRGRVTYIGRDLPPSVERVRDALTERAAEITTRKLQLYNQHLALSRLIGRYELTAGDRLQIVALGFSGCLLHQPSGVPDDQDTP